MRFWIGIAIIFYGVLGLAVTLGLLIVLAFTDAELSTRGAGVVLMVPALLPVPMLATLSVLHLLVPSVLERLGYRIRRSIALLTLFGSSVVLAPAVWLVARWSAELPGESSSELAIGLLLVGGPLLAFALVAFLLAVRMMRG